MDSRHLYTYHVRRNEQYGEFMIRIDKESYFINNQTF